MQTAFLVTCGLLVAGVILRTRLRFLQRTHIPASVVAGALGFALVQCLQMQSRSPRAAGFGAGLAGEWKTWPTFLVAVVFAGLVMERAPGAFRDSARKAAVAGLFA